MKKKRMNEKTQNRYINTGITLLQYNYVKIKYETVWEYIFALETEDLGQYKKCCCRYIRICDILKI